MNSPCVDGRERHRFRSPKTRSLTPDLKCWYCHKTVVQVQQEQQFHKSNSIRTDKP